MFGHLPNALNQILPPKILFLSAIPTPLKTSLSITITRQTKRFQLTISTLFYYYYSSYLLLLFHLLISFLFEFFRSRESFPQKNGMHSCKFSELLCPQHSESIPRISLSIFILTAFRFWPCVSHPLNYLLLTNFNTKLINLTHCKSVAEFQKNTKIIARA